MTRRFETRWSPTDAANELEKVCSGGKGSGIPYVGSFDSVNSREKPNGGYEITARSNSMGFTTEVIIDVDPNRDTGNTKVTVTPGRCTSNEEARKVGEDIEEKYFHA
jgi:hypothetical protein